MQTLAQTSRWVLTCLPRVQAVRKLAASRGLRDNALSLAFVVAAQSNLGRLYPRKVEIYCAELLRIGFLESRWIADTRTLSEFSQIITGRRRPWC